MTLVPSFFELDPWSNWWSGGPSRRARRRTSPLGYFENVDRDIANAFNSLDISRPGSELGLFSPHTETESGGVEGKEPGKYTMNIFLGSHIKPEDIKVTCKNNVMTIDAKKEYRSDDGNARVYQEFMRRFTLPQNVEMKEIKSELTPEGYLTVEAPVHRQAIQEQKKAQAIPIKKE